MHFCDDIRLVYFSMKVLLYYSDTLRYVWWNVESKLSF